MNRVPKDDDPEIGFNDTLYGFFGRQLTDDAEYCVKDPRYIKFHERLKTIMTAGQQHGLAAGEEIAIISKQFGYSFSTLPFGRIDEIKQWIIENAYRKLEILSPDLHSRLMAAPPEMPGVLEYQRQFKKPSEPERKYWD